MNSNNTMIVISGISTSGKTSVFESLNQKFAGELTSVLSTTTRQVRDGEQNGINYEFLSQEDFLANIDDFIEYTTFNGNYYGYRYSNVEEALKTSKLPVMIIDGYGLQQLKINFSSCYQIKGIYIQPKPLISYVKRFRERGMGFSEIISRGRSDYSNIAKYRKLYDYYVQNKTGNFQETVEKVGEIIKCNF